MRQNDNVPKNKENLAENSPENDSTHISKPDEVVGAEKTDSTESHSVNPEDYADEANEREANRELAADHAIDEEEDAETQDDPAHDDEALEISEAEDAETEDAEEEDAEEEINSEVTAEGHDDESAPGSDGDSDPDAPNAPVSSASGEESGTPAPARPRAKPRARAAKLPTRTVTLVVNDEPGDECRIAILANQRLDSYFSEREATATNVGSIYKGKVMNVEGAIQAAFIDFGSGQNGFLHISDLHPKYFPGEERTEQVGKKIGRSERPLIQQALRKGQEILVQVIKEGLGSKGPTLTSYLSLPGRLLVMMPDMDRVGVSRRVEDEDQRREMRKILDSLQLPEGFGFILRTAGFDSTKTELQRDAAYLQRLWDAMEKRSSKTGAPCELYTESDVLVRTLRDHTDSTVESIIVDSPGAFERAKMFLDVIAPKTSGKVMYYNGKAPIFEAYGIERQIDEIHSRTVALPSGGALVFDQTEALVAIDVNSGRSRSARDSETNAYQTNSEAVEEVCRQLRLRDLGGLIVVDCIDMRLIKHRRDIEERLTTLLKIDRAKSSFAPISEFGIIEMTRQRMRPSLRKMHYADCTHCAGSGEIRVPAAVAADAMRRVALLFSHAKIQRVEIVCSVRVAAEFMSNRRRAMHELEDRSSKRIDVRISEAFAADRVEMYAYDEMNSDIELDRLPPLGGPLAGTLHEELPEAEEVELTPSEALARRRRRKRRPAPADATAIALAGGFEDLPEVLDDEVSVRDSMAEREEQSGSTPGSSRSSRSGDNRQGASRGGRDNRGGRGGRGGRTDDQKSAPSGDRTPNAGNRSNASSGSNSNRNESGESRGQRSNRRRRGRGRRTVGSIMDMVQERSAFETNRVAGVLDTTVEELLTRLRADCDVETAALLTLETFMLPPELIARAQTLYPEVDRGNDSEPESDGNAAGNEDPQSADSLQDGQHQDGQRDSSTSGGRDDRGPNRNDGGGRSGRGRRGGSRRGGGGGGGGGNSGANSGGNSGGNSAGGNRGGRNDNRGGSRSQGGSQGGGASHGSSSQRERQPLKIDQRSDTPTPAPAPTPPPTPAAAPAPTPTAEAPAKPKRRSLYGAAMRLISPFEKSKAKGRKE
jgi:ribonuclease E